ncbi:hypothetical protein RIF29_31912 [Crotalaria pallida]|uniref:Uncharacterized protein n=1 Tax=Crotalaria pallida TaxID=3830 RepID=A0AAN9EI56_CROPI
MHSNGYTTAKSHVVLCPTTPILSNPESHTFNTDFFPMDPLPSPLPVKANNSKPKINPKAKLATTGEPQRQNRVFGTARSTNIPSKYVSDVSITKPKIGVPHRKPKSIRATTQPPFDTSTKIITITDKNSPQVVANPRMNKKSDTLFPQRVVEKPIISSKNNSQQENDSCSEEPKTPVVRATKAKVVPPASTTTPFYTAAHCSKCRFDKFETSSYWVGHIKMAESVGKHFVACAFFRLAFESQAEPIRELRMELKRYLLRHGYLSVEQQEWREVASRYGLLKVESNTSGIDSSTKLSGTCMQEKSE